MRGVFGRASVLLALASGIVATSVHACKEPTQVTVDIRTLGFKCAELKKITIVVAKEPEAAETKWEFPQAEVEKCAGDFEVGTLVVTPSGNAGAVMVLASYTDAKCIGPKYEGCIVARRRFSFIENVPLRVPITLEASCKDVPCNALSSCRSGVCVTSETDCSSDGTCEAISEPVIAPDGGTVAPPLDATIDAPVNDTGIPPTDSGTDAPIVADSGPDVLVGPSFPDSGNNCPASAAGPDCFDMPGLVCCAQGQAFLCIQDGGCTGGPAFPCTGREHCGAGFCCAPQIAVPMGPTSSCFIDPTCGDSGVVLCNGEADCPPGRTCDGGIYTGRMNGVMKYCTR